MNVPCHRSIIIIIIIIIIISISISIIIRSEIMYHRL